MAKSNLTKIATAAALIAGGSILAACGGGGGGGGTTAPPTAVSPPPPPPPPPTSQAPTWTQDVFESASTFENQCATPRSGVDIEGNPFPDQAGSLIEELFWLRSWTEETYLWNDQVTDQDPAGFNNRLTYFGVLKTNAVTSSGEDLDDFHFSEPTDEFLERRNSAASSGYGVSLAVFRTSPPRDYRVRYTEPNSPASESVNGQVNFVRGARILEVDGVDLVNGGSQADIDALNRGLFPATAGETHTFLVQDPGASSSRTITVTSADVAQAPVNRTNVISTSSGNVGYILFNTFSPFSSEEAIADAITEMKNANVTDLVLDLRYNGGGLLAVASQLSYMIAGPARTNGKTFELLQFNANAGNRNPVTGNINNPIPFYDEGLGFSLADNTPLDDLNLGRVYILSTGRTCSASEAVINGLRGIDVDIVLIGDVTCGKPYGFYPTDNCGETYYTIQFRGVNDKDFGDYSDGFVPNNSTFAFGERVSGCVVSDDLNTELGDPSEGLLAAALDYRENGTCPAITPKVTVETTFSKPDLSTVATTALSEQDDFIANNRDMTLP